ncbi:MAG: hypothetical protein ABSG05_02165 [Candidatus Pacearchaeota archaeon]|jgi:hypothetical protein
MDNLSPEFKRIMRILAIKRNKFAESRADYYRSLGVDLPSLGMSPEEMAQVSLNPKYRIFVKEYIHTLDLKSEFRKRYDAAVEKSTLEARAQSLPKLTELENSDKSLVERAAEIKRRRVGRDPFI